jgi:hypothetical protein
MSFFLSSAAAAAAAVIVNCVFPQHKSRELTACKVARINDTQQRAMIAFLTSSLWCTHELIFCSLTSFVHVCTCAINSHKSRFFENFLLVFYFLPVSKSIAKNKKR